MQKQRRGRWQSTKQQHGMQQFNTKNVKRRPCQDIRGQEKLVSYQIPAANSEKELAVIRAIIAREQAISDLLAHVSKYKPQMAQDSASMDIKNSCFGALDQVTTDLLLHMRITSVLVCEAVLDWRYQLTMPRPFVWQRKNYIQGMACDINFLHFDKSVSTILGAGRTKRNPFVTEGRNIDELTQFQWGPNPSEEPKSVHVSGIDALRLKYAARMIVEEEMRCGKADAKMPPPAWYIQRKKRMLAMGINLQAGADEPDKSKSSHRRTKPPPRKKKNKNTHLSPEEKEIDGSIIETAANAVDPSNSDFEISHVEKLKKNSKKKRRLLNVTSEQKLRTQTVKMHVPGCKKIHLTGRTNDGRVFLSHAVAWLLPPKETGHLEEVMESSSVSQSLVTAKGIVEKPRRQNVDQHFGKGTNTVVGEHDDIDDRIVIQVEIFLPNRSSPNGCCGPAVNSSHLVVPMKDLEKGGFVHLDKVSDAGKGTLLNLPKKQNKKNKAKMIVRKSAKRGRRNAKLNRKSKRNMQIEAESVEHDARIERVNASMAFLLNRLAPLSDGKLSWRPDGPVVAARKWKQISGILKSMEGGVDQILFEGTKVDPSQNAKSVLFEIDSVFNPINRKYHRQAIRIGRYWCAVRTWIPWESGGGIEFEITTVAPSPMTKMLSLDLSAVVRLLGTEFFGRKKIAESKKVIDTDFHTDTDFSNDTKSSKTTGSKRSTHNVRSGPKSKGAGSRPSSRGAGSRPSSRGAGSRPSSRGAGSRPSSRGAGSRPPSRGAGSRPSSRGTGTFSSSKAGGSRPRSRSESRNDSRSSSRPSSRKGDSRPSSRSGCRKRDRHSKKRTTFVKVDGIKICMSDSPPLPHLTREVLKKCVVVVDTPHGPEFYAQAPAYVYDNSTPDIRLPSPVAAPEVIAAAAATSSKEKSTRRCMQTTESASGQMLGQLVGHELPEDTEKIMKNEGTSIGKGAISSTTLKPKTKTKIWQGGAMVGGLHFLIDMYLDHKSRDIHVHATYPTSGSTIHLNVSYSLAVSICSDRNVTADDDSKVKDYSYTSEKQHTGYSTSSTDYEVACALVEELDLDHHEPPNLILTRNKIDGGAISHVEPLVALMAPLNNISEVQRVRPLSPVMLPVFKPDNRQYDIISSLTTTANNVNHEEVSISKVNATLEQDLMVEPGETDSEHRKALASTKQVPGGGMMVTVIPTSPQKMRQYNTNKNI